MNAIDTFRASFRRYQASAWALVLANAVPLVGVLLFGWNAFDIVALYWAENVIIGAINVLKILTCRPDPAALDFKATAPPGKEAELRRQVEAFSSGGNVKAAHVAAKLFMSAFFTVHYGLFCLVHGVFITVLLAKGGPFRDPFEKARDMLGSPGSGYLLLAAAGLAASHLYSFLANYLGRGEFRRTLPIVLMFQPYARIVVLHLAILFGGFVAMALGNGSGVLVLLVIGKTVLDLKLHFRERQRMDTAAKETSQDQILYGN